MNPYDARPWLKSYPAQREYRLAGPHALALFDDAVARSADRPAIKYFDGSLSYRELDQASDAFAIALSSRGFMAGDRLGIYLQNVPPFVIALLAAWKLGGIPVPINPMNRKRELEILVADCRPKAIICHGTLFDEVVSQLADRPAIVFTTSASDYQTRYDPRLFAQADWQPRPQETDFLAALAKAHGKPERAPQRPEDLAFLVYTSGTTGVPKGSMNTHRGATHATGTLVSWFALERGGAVLGLAPLFHITGLICHLLAAFALAAPLILSYRFEAGVMLDAAEEHEARFSIGATTAYLAMFHHPLATPGKLKSLQVAASGGAPVPAEAARQWQAKFGLSLVNAYGMTETNAPVVMAPRDGEGRVDPATGALSIGLPLPETDIWIAGDDGHPAPLGSAGEIVINGPTLAAGYWQKPAETQETLREDGLRSGDVGFMDADGWVYLVDRKKDMIVASGYKVWPREVEDVLYTHPAVREAAVIGVPDEYRGETVKAVVSLKPGLQAVPDEIIEFCRDRMAAYKRPRLVEIIPELPKTVTGKILRRSLRGRS